MDWVLIKNLRNNIGRQVEIRGWLYNQRSSGKIRFLIMRDGSGTVQCVLTRGDNPELFKLAGEITQESSLKVIGTVQEDSRSPIGVEVSVISLEVIGKAEPYPISLKEHGVDFLSENRHLWIRTPRQASILRIRSTVEKACRDFFHQRDFVLADSPIITPAACEGTTNLFEINYHDEKAYLSQSGQLYNEATAMALGRVYCFGPTFRAEKSKTRRHLMEFWMLEAEAAFLEFEENMKLQEDLICHLVRTVLSENRSDLITLGRDIGKLEAVSPPFPRLSYTEAVDILKKEGFDFEWGNDFGAPEETALSGRFSSPVFIHRFPAAIKAFYMEPDPENPNVILGADLLAPEGYGEIIGGSQRISDPVLLRKKIEEHNLPVEIFNWYLDLRRYGTVPHSGFGLGIERTVAWLCGIEHVREAIPFPRTLYRMYP
ncbi:MAG: asparagine--tRNA ligase [Bacillota bacterium]